MLSSRSGTQVMRSGCLTRCCHASTPTASPRSPVVPASSSCMATCVMNRRWKLRWAVSAWCAIWRRWSGLAPISTTRRSTRAATTWGPRSCWPRWPAREPVGSCLPRRWWSMARAPTRAPSTGWPRSRRRGTPGDITTPLWDGSIHALLTWEYSFAPQPLNRRLAQFRLLDDPLLAVLPAGHPLSARADIALADLAHEPGVARAHAAPYENAYETMCRIAGFEPEIAFRVDDYEALQGLVAAGLGVSMAPAL